MTAGSGNTNTTFSGDISGGGGLTKVGTGPLTLTGTTLYTGATNIYAGAAGGRRVGAASPFFVNSGGTLGGTGTVGTTTVASGGTVAPGNPIGTLNVNGTIAFNTGSTYAIDVSPAAADKIAVSGTASLAGTAQATFQGGSYAPKVYTILSSAGLGGKFDTFTVVGKPSGFSASLDYTSTDALLILQVSTLGQDTTLNQPAERCQRDQLVLQRRWRLAAGVPGDFQPRWDRSSRRAFPAFRRGGDSASRSASMMTGQFLGLMLDAFVDGRSANAFGGGGWLSRKIRFTEFRTRLWGGTRAVATASAVVRPPLERMGHGIRRRGRVWRQSSIGSHHFR